MTIERIKEALEQAKGGLEWYNKNNPEMKEQIKWQETIIWALEIQVPQKPLIIDEDFDYFECPHCSVSIYVPSSDFSEHKNCLNCGQRLDWGVK